MAAERAPQVNPPPAPAVAVWDRPVRLVHWSLAISCVIAWVTSEIFLRWHEPVGYFALALVAFRVIWGFAGSPYARFSQFVRSPSATRNYAGSVFRGASVRYIGHNPLGGWMALALWSCVASLGFTGWLQKTDMFWGYEWLSLLHLGLAWTLIVLVVVHVTGAIVTGRKHKESLVGSMLTGDKRAPEPGDVG